MTGVALVSRQPIVKIPVVTFGSRVLYALQPKQYQAYKLTPLWIPQDEPYPGHIGCGGAAGGGKSYLSRCILTAAALKWPGSTFILFRRSEREVKENHVNKFRVEVPDKLDGERLYTWNGSDLCATWFNGSKTYFGYLRHDDDVYTYQGPEYDGMIFEEATQYSFFQVQYLTGNRLRATIPESRPFAVYPSNPGNKGHFWYKRLFVDRRYHQDDGEDPDSYAFLQMFLRDNLELQHRDPGYARRLDTLPEPWRSWQRDGDFAAGAGTALGQLSREKHLIPSFEIPPHWVRFGSFDWGFAHPFSFGEYAVNEDGVVFKIQTITGRRLHDGDIARRILDKLDHTRLSYIVAGHDCWAEVKARGENPPTTAETFTKFQLYLMQANISRPDGLKALREAVNPEQEDGIRLFFLDNEGNRRCFEQLEARVADPDDPEDVLKTDADDWGEGGDDMYDETRYAISSRYQSAKPQGLDKPVESWSQEVLAAEHARLYRGRGDKVVQHSDRPVWDHPEFGDVL